jgi:Tol biopolymer transport system component
MKAHNREVRMRVIAGLLFMGIVGCTDSPTDPAEPPPVTSVVVTPGAHTLAAGGTVQLQAVARTSRGDTVKGAPMAWRSSDTLVAKVSAGGMVSGRGDGTARITATSGSGSGHADITVEDLHPTPTIASFSPASATTGGPDLTLTIRGTGFRPNVRVQWNGHARPTQYVSPTELRATVWAADRAQAGTMRVQVVNAPPGGGPSAEVEYRIVEQTVPVASIELSHSVAMTLVGAPVPVAAKVRDGAGNILNDRLITWTSSNQLVAAVNGSGLVQAVGVGEAVITATSEGRSATVAVSVGTKAVHLILDDANARLFGLDMRRGGPPVPFWESSPGSRAVDPSVSADGRWIAFTVELGTIREIRVLDQATRTYHFLTSDGKSDQAAWSPAGDRIAFRSGRAGRADIWIAKTDGTDAVNLTHTMPEGWGAEFPAWSPDGTRLVFAAGPAATAGQYTNTNLYLINPDGTNRRPLLTAQYQDSEPAWHGDAVVFTRRTPDGRSDLFRVPVGGGPLLQLTHTGNATAPSWSPDGRWIAYAAANAASGRSDIMAVRPFGDEARPLSLASATGGGGRNPTWLTHN